MVKIRLARVGRKHQPSYRIVVVDSRVKRTGANIAILGMYNPLAEPSIFEIDKKAYADWLGKGAQPTDRVKRLVSPEIIKTFKHPKAPKKEVQAKELESPQVEEKVESTEAPEVVESVESGEATETEELAKSPEPKEETE